MTTPTIRAAVEAHANACREALAAMRPLPVFDRLAELSGANLRDADLSDADLSDANLRYANLRGANLRYANLRGANLPPTYRIASLCFGGWSVTVTPETTAIGCQRHPNADWLRWTPDDVAHMHDDAKSWWTRHRESVCAVIRDVMQPEQEQEPKT